MAEKFGKKVSKYTLFSYEIAENNLIIYFIYIYK